jgi:hypothetical protein
MHTDISNCQLAEMTCLTDMVVSSAGDTKLSTAEMTDQVVHINSQSIPLHAVLHVIVEGLKVQVAVVAIIMVFIELLVLAKLLFRSEVLAASFKGANEIARRTVTFMSPDVSCVV